MWECVQVCTCMCVCHRCRTRCEMGLARRRPERCGAMPTGGPCLFTVHPNRQPNTYHHPTTVDTLHVNLTFIRTMKTIPHCQPQCLFFLAFCWNGNLKKRRAAVVEWEFLEVPVEVNKLDGNPFVSSLQQILFTCLTCAPGFYVPVCFLYCSRS